MNSWAFAGIVVGLLFGYALQKGRFCMNSAFRDILVLKDYTLLKAVMLAIAVEMIGFELMAISGLIHLNPKPFWWGANLVGGYVFGIGMALAGGCASGITYRFGEGMVGAMSAVVGFTFGALMTKGGVLHPIAATLQEHTLTKAPDGSNWTLANLLHIPYPILAFGLGLLILLWLYLSYRREEKESAFRTGWHWATTGIVIGIIGMLGFWTSAKAGRNYPLGITGGYVTVAKSLLSNKNYLSWESFEVMFAIVGAFVAAITSKEFKLRAPKPKVIIQTFFGGLFMGFGAVTSLGCNIGHILSGVPQLSIASIVGGVAIVLGVWSAAYVMFMRE